jgi:hypothetical protein
MISKFTRKDFLEALFGDYYKEHRGFILVKSFKRGDPKMSTRYFPNIEILAKEYYGDERDVYFGIAPRERMKAEKEHIHHMVALWANLDIGREGHEHKEHVFESPQHAAKAIRSFPKTPSIIVESGRGAHLYWLLREVDKVKDVEKIESILKNIGTFLKCDIETEIDTTLRLPETVNTKVPSQLLNCDVKFINTNFRYGISDFENLGERIETVTTAVRGTGQPGAGTTASPSAPSRKVGGGAELPGMMGGPTSTESLVLDETIIDELIDDISMTGSVIVDTSMPKRAPATTGAVDEDAELISDDDYEVAPVSEAVDPPPVRKRPSAPPPVTPIDEEPLHTGGAGISTGQVQMSSAFLQKLVSSKATVEVSLLGSDTVVKGTLTWNEGGLIGIKSGKSNYTIPISSVSFVKSEA